jgi:hypothetical protein
VLSFFARILRLGSAAACLITIASFTLFAVNQTATASAHQQKVLNGEAPAPNVAGLPNANGEPSTLSPSGRATGARPAPAKHKRSLRTVIDEVSSELTSPFSGVVSSSSSEWTKRVTLLLLALAAYGFGLGFLARRLKLRV